MKENKNVDIVKNVKIIEWLKCELLTGVSTLFKFLIKGVENTKEGILDILAHIIIVCYLLGKRFGFSYEIINKKIQNKLKLGLIEEHQIEKWYGDLSYLLKCFKNIKE